MKPFDPRLLRYAPRARSGVVLTVLLGALRAVLAVAQALLLARVLARGFEGAGLEELRVPVVWVGVVLVSRGLLTSLQDLVSRRTCTAVQEQLRCQVLARVAALGPGWLAHRRSGELATLVGPGIGALEGYFRSYLPQLVLSILVPTSVLGVLTVIDWRSAVIVAVALPLLPVFLALVGMHTRRATAHQWRELSRLGGHFLDVVTGLPTLRAFGRAQAQVDVLRRITTRHREATMATLRTAFLSSLVLELVATLAVAVLAVSVGFRLLAGDVSFETALVVLLLAPEAFLPLRAVGTSFHAAMDGVSAAEAAFDVLDQQAPAPAGHARVVPRPTTATAIELRSATVLHHDRDVAALGSVDLRVGRGEHVALVGASGSGKSTLLGVVLGLVPLASGQALLDGVALDLSDLDAWRSRLAWVPQAPHLFARSVADNIRIGSRGATDEQVRAAAAAAHAEEFVLALPHGFDTLLGERGTGLSVGQVRRIALARAFLRDAPLLLLDEPTAGLDPHSEALVAASLGRLCADRTVLLATHRRELLDPSYRVVELDRGAVRSSLAATR